MGWGSCLSKAISLNVRLDLNLHSLPLVSLARLGLDPGFYMAWPGPALRAPLSSLTYLDGGRLHHGHVVRSPLSEFPLRRAPLLPSCSTGLG